MRATPFLIVAGALAALSQTPGQGPAGGAGGGRPGPAVSSSVRLEDWALFRSAAAPVLGWKVGIPSIAFRQLTFSQAAAKADALGLATIEGFSWQKFSAEIPKNLDQRLTPNELEAVKDRLRALNMRMPAYSAAVIGPNEAEMRKLFEFAKTLNVETIVGAPDPASLPALDKLATEFSVNIALVSRDPKSALQALEGRSKRIGAAVDIANWMQAGVKPLEGLAILKDRVLTLNVRDMSGARELLADLYKREIKPSYITIDTAGGPDPAADLTKSFEAFDKAVQPVLADRVNQLSRTAEIRGPDRVPPEDRKKIEAALPQHALAKPKKPRKLLVLDLNVAYGGHRSIPHANLALELMAKQTGAYEPVFNNNLDNLKYGNIKQFDAIYLNNTVGMIFVDPEVREGLTRFVREGGGLMGNHGVSHASMDWAEFGEMIGVKWGVHREPTEIATIRIDDPKSPLTASFHGKEFTYQDEFFRFPIGPYSREKLHVLLSMDVEKTDMNQGRPCAKPCVRPDQDYAVSWIRNYGKGRVFFCILGHNPTIYTTPALAEYFLAGIQFILGDLDADATPSAKLH
jgi:type 1 glutamine amidotransferase/sugar phosphate isomerase/epimerase